jgi:hypothetical protein
MLGNQGTLLCWVDTRTGQAQRWAAARFCFTPSSMARRPAVRDIDTRSGCCGCPRKGLPVPDPAANEKTLDARLETVIAAK